MKKLILLTLVILFSAQSFSQSLEGVWEGKFVTCQRGSALYNVPIDTTSIKLRFIPDGHNSYDVYSVTRDTVSSYREITVICKMVYKLQKGSILLEETEVIDPKNYETPCFQKMKLKIKKQGEIIRLEGTWTNDLSKDCRDSGIIYFEKLIVK